jgi:hypothetical protein
MYFHGFYAHSLFLQSPLRLKATDELVKMLADTVAVIGPPDAWGRILLYFVRNLNLASFLIDVGAEPTTVGD